MTDKEKEARYEETEAFREELRNLPEALKEELAINAGWIAKGYKIGFADAMKARGQTA